MRKHLLNGTVALSLALSACSLAPNYQRPEMALPTGWSNVAGVGATQQNTSLFWQDLGSVELDRLIDQVLAQNLDLEAALQRIDQARAQAKIASSPLYPNVSASGSKTPTPQTSAAASATKSTFGARIVTRRSPPTFGSTPPSSIARRCASWSPQTRLIFMLRF